MTIRAALAALQKAYEGLEEPHVAAALFDEVARLSHPADFRFPDEYGIALAWVGRLDEAERMLRLALDRNPKSAVAAFRLGTVLAEQRRFAEANMVFALDDAPQAWAAGGTMRSIRLVEKEHLVFQPEHIPFSRKVEGLIDGTAKGHRYVYIVAADSRYIKRFARSLHSSLDSVKADCLLHIHAINPDETTIRLLTYMQRRPGPSVHWSLEVIDFPDLTHEQKKVYYASARFFIASELIRHYMIPIIIADIDQMVVKDPFLLTQSREEICALVYAFGRYNFMARFSASIIIAPRVTAATYFDRVAAYLADMMRDRTAIGWHLDQIALNVAHLASDDISLEALPAGVMLSAAPGQEIPPEAFFWSVTYSISSNAQKLTEAAFTRYEKATVVVLTHIYKHSNNFVATANSVVAENYGNVIHIVKDYNYALANFIIDCVDPDFITADGPKSAAALIASMTLVPPPIFVHLPCGERLRPGGLLDLMLAVEKGEVIAFPSGEDGLMPLLIPPDLRIMEGGETPAIFGWHRTRAG